MTEELENSIRTKRYSSLSEEERTALLKLEINEEDFNTLKSFYMQLGEKSNTIEVGSEVKKNLDELFTSTYPNQSTSFFKRLIAILFPQDKAVYMRPIIQFASVAFLITLGITVFNTNKSFDRNISQYVPKKFDLKLENETNESEGNEVILNEEIEEEKVQLSEQKHIEFEFQKSVETIQEIESKPQLITTKKTEKETNEFLAVLPDLDNDALIPSTTEQNSTALFLTSTAYASPTHSQVTVNTNLSLNKGRLAKRDEEKSSTPVVTENASYNNLAVLDLLIPLF